MNKVFDVIVTENKVQLKEGILTTEGIIQEVYADGDIRINMGLWRADKLDNLISIKVQLREKPEIEKPAAYIYNIVAEYGLTEAPNEQKVVCDYNNHIKSLKTYEIPSIELQNLLKDEKEAIEGIDFVVEEKCCGLIVGLVRNQTLSERCKYCSNRSNFFAIPVSAPLKQDDIWDETIVNYNTDELSYKEIQAIIKFINHTKIFYKLIQITKM